MIKNKNKTKQTPQKIVASYHTQILVTCARLIPFLPRNQEELYSKNYDDTN